LQSKDNIPCGEQCNLISTEPNAGTSDPTDGRNPYQYKSCYPIDVRKEILLEAIYLFTILFITFSFILATWRGWTYNWLLLTTNEEILFRKYSYYAAAGMLGGITFGMKYFYRVVARGYWHQDRRWWRIMSPFIAMVTAIIIGAMVDASFMTTRQPVTGASVISIGFLAGYFADEAVGKMYEIATVVFGKTIRRNLRNEMAEHEKKTGSKTSSLS
jgi:hypothetical protein